MQKISAEDEASLRLIRKKEVAALLGISPYTVNDWVKARKFPPPLPLPGPHRWKLATVEAWIAKHERSRRKVKQSARGMFRES